MRLASIAVGVLLAMAAVLLAARALFATSWAPTRSSVAPGVVVVSGLRAPLTDASLSLFVDRGDGWCRWIRRDVDPARPVVEEIARVRGRCDGSRVGWWFDGSLALVALDGQLYEIALRHRPHALSLPPHAPGLDVGAVAYVARSLVPHPVLIGWVDETGDGEATLGAFELEGATWRSIERRPSTAFAGAEMRGLGVTALLSPSSALDLEQHLGASASPPLVVQIRADLVSCTDDPGDPDWGGPGVAVEIRGGWVLASCGDGTDAHVYDASTGELVFSAEAAEPATTLRGAGESAVFWPLPLAGP